MPSGEVLTAPPAEFLQMPVLVTYVGGPADGRTERLPSTASRRRSPSRAWPTGPDRAYPPS
ncbi:hypothetical protein ACU686_36160 [Yinghuangia aomiensis]